MRKTLLAVAIACVCSTLPFRDSHATVSTETYLSDTTCSGGTTYSVTFPFLDEDHLSVIKYTGACGSDTYSALVVDTDFAVARTGAETGTVELIGSATCTSGYCLRITRDTPIKQETSFRSQGIFSPGVHEEAFDKLTMLVQEVVSAVGEGMDLAAHKAADHHTIYARLAGRSGGTTINGGTDNGDDLSLQPTSHATKGDVILGAQLYCDGANDMVGINDSSPSYTLDVTGDIYATDDIYAGANLYGSVASGGNLDLGSTAHATKGVINFGTNANYNEVNETWYLDDDDARVYGGPASSDADITIRSNPDQDGLIVLGDAYGGGNTSITINEDTGTIGISATSLLMPGFAVQGLDVEADFSLIPYQESIPSSGDANPAAYTDTYAADGAPIMEYTCNDPDDCAVTLEDTGDAGIVYTFVNVDTNVCTFADVAGTQEVSATLAAAGLGQWDSVTFYRSSGVWIQIGHNDN